MRRGPIERLKSHCDCRWLVAAVCCTLSVLFLSHMPQDPTPEALQEGFFHVDKAEHLLAYGIITLLLMMSLRKPKSLAFVTLAFVAIVAIGAFDELTQPIFNRQASITDFIADMIGVLIGGILSQGTRR